jgi:hypothetical protein
MHLHVLQQIPLKIINNHGHHLLILKSYHSNNSIPTTISIKINNKNLRNIGYSPWQSRILSLPLSTPAHPS